MSLLKWQEELLIRLDTLSLVDLLDEAFISAMPDDYDGGMTERGTWVYKNTVRCLFERLKKLNLLSDVDIDKLMNSLF